MGALADPTATPPAHPATPEGGAATAAGAAAAQPAGFWRRPFGRGLKWSGLAALAVALALTAYLYFYGVLGSNFHRVQDGPRTLYRSAQLSATELEARVKEDGIRSVVNLRGANPGKAWYDAESAALRGLGVQQIDIKMSGRRLPSRETLGALIGALKNAPRPVLVHCESGADRTGLACACERLLATADDFGSARGELVFWPYGHTGWGGYAAMDRVIDQFEHYRRNGGTMDLEPWAATVYDPGIDGAPAGGAETTGE